MGNVLDCSKKLSVARDTCRVRRREATDRIK